MTEPTDAPSAEALVRSLLDRYRDAFVMALGEDGLAVDLPTTVVLDGQRLATGRSVLDIVVRDHRHRIIDAWSQAKEAGAARTQVRLDGAEVDTRIDFLDARPAHGVLLAFLAPLDGGDLPRRSARTGPALVAPPRVAVVRKDELAVFTGIDDATTGMLGWTANELLQARSLDLVHPDDQDLAIESWLDLLEHPESQERVRLRYRTKDERWRWLEIANHNRLHDDEHRDVLAEMVDVTDEVQAVEALRASEELLRRLADTVPVGLAQVDLEGRTTYANDRLDQLVGTSDRPLLVERFAHAEPGDADLLATAIDAAVRHGKDGEAECRFAIGPQGGALRLAIDVRALIDETGAPTGAIACVSDVTESVRMRHELAERALRDPLTGGHNRPGLFAALDDLLAAPGRRVAVLFVDLDGFKAVNDRLGHHIGDEVLRVVANRLAGALDDDHTIGRLGGDEFVVLCPDAARDERALAEVAGRIDAVLGSPLVVDGVEVPLSASVGLAHAPGGTGIEPAAVIAAADAAMYRAKHARRAGTELPPVVVEV